MAIIACQECDHKVSERAASCPGCGAPIAAPTAVLQRGQRALIAAVIASAALALLGGELFQRGPHAAIRAGASGTSTSADPGPASPTGQASTVESTGAPAGSTRTVYQTTAAQLYLDYLANGVATQSKIANSRVRVAGTILAIDEDAAGEPVVKLAANNNDSVNMTLGQDEIAAAAQLSRGQAVDVQCDSMRRVMGSPEGSHCSLVLVQGRVAPAVFEASHVVVAPAPAGVPHREASLPPAEAPIPVAGPSRRSLKSVPPPITIAMVPAVPGLGVGDAAVSTPLPPRETTAIAPLPMSGIQATAPAASAVPTARAVSEESPASAQDASPSASSAAPVVAATAADEPAATEPPASPSPRTADDLESVRAADPQAAEHIAAYCARTAGATGTASCLRDEREAWIRFVQNNEFPTLNEAIRLKCSQPPFPDSYRAKEICAKYELRVY